MTTLYEEVVAGRSRWRTAFVAVAVTLSVAGAVGLGVWMLSENASRSTENSAIIERLERQQDELQAAVRRLERLEHPTRLDLQRLFRGLLVAATPRDVRRLVRRLHDLGVELPRRGVDIRGGKPPPG